MKNPFEKLTIEDLQKDKQQVEKTITQILSEFNEKYPNFVSYIEIEYSNINSQCGIEKHLINVKIKLESK